MELHQSEGKVLVGTPSPKGMEQSKRPMKKAAVFRYCAEPTLKRLPLFEFESRPSPAKHEGRSSIGRAVTEEVVIVLLQISCGFDSRRLSLYLKGS